MPVYYIPNGPKNLASLFPGIDFTKVDEYTIQVIDDSSNVLATSTLNKVDKLCEDDIKIHFVNSLGTVDSVVFTVFDIQNDSKSDSMQTPTQVPLIKSLHGINRFNIKANYLYQAYQEFDETELEWLTELFNSPFVWMEWTGTQSQGDDYLPLVVLDQKSQLKKETDRFSYTVIIQFNLSHEKRTLRG